MRTPGFRRLCARQELKLPALERELSLELTRQGISPADADALAANTALLFLAIDWEIPPASPAALLERYSLSQLLTLYEDYRDFLAGNLDYGEVQP